MREREFSDALEREGPSGHSRARTRQPGCQSSRWQLWACEALVELPSPPSPRSALCHAGAPREPGHLSAGPFIKAGVGFARRLPRASLRTALRALAQVSRLESTGLASPGRPATGPQVGGGLLGEACYGVSCFTATALGQQCSTQLISLLPNIKLKPLILLLSSTSKKMPHVSTQWVFSESHRQWALVTFGHVGNPTGELFCSVEKLLISWVGFNKCLLST